jgi:MFS superfamily sulfate permease-like transporter
MTLARTLRQDLPASLVVFFVAVPLCLGIALASGAPPLAGLIAGIIGGAVVGAISGSALGVSGPAAGLAVIVLEAIDALGFQVFLVAVVLAGVLQLVLGAARAGVLGYFFPSAVIRGMLAGIGIIIVLKQIPHAVGFDQDPLGELQYHQPDGATTFSELGISLDVLTPNAVLVALASLAILILWDQVLAKRVRLFQFVQGPLVAVGFGIAYQVLTTRFAPDWAFAPEHLVAVPIPEAGGLTGLRELLVLPDWGAGLGSLEVWTVAVTIAVVGSLETLLCLDATDKLDPQRRVTPANRELVAQGVGNILAGWIGGLPITQVIVRSSANIQSGGRTKLSAILHGVIMLGFVVALPEVLNLVPLSVLAAILFVVGYKLAKPALFRRMYAMGWEQFVPFLVTILGLVFTDLLQGIAYGLACAIFVILRRNFLNSHFLHMEQSDDASGHSVRITLSEEVTFLNKARILQELARVPDGSRVTIDRSHSLTIDPDVEEVIEDFQRSAAERGITVTLVGEPAGPRVAAAPAG